MQLVCFNLSQNCDEIGYPGFSHFFQVQAQDEFLHQRRIMNYILDNGSSYQLDTIKIEVKKFTNIIDILKEYIHHRTHFAKITNDFTEEAKNQMDYTTVKFYEWFAIDFYEEISETNDLIDWLNMSNKNHYEIDKKVLARENPNTLSVIDPFAPHQD